MQLHVRRVYEAAAARGEGHRVLVDRLWPRGKSRADLDGVPWVKSVAPSDALRAWFGHEPAKWAEFKRRYFAELDANPDAVAELRKALGHGANATLLYAAHDEAHNNAVALAEYLSPARGRTPP
ncbi:DUF488 family protein [Luteimonas sp. MC1572]|uniref:DUF488 domain-containing protein n=1 Tax=Luteimonas sp. MC1572 TaxID=2799325 RepID=UPI0018F0C93F|nr:DUF488 family protein [Luteimonas sp. MC1572]MBJ6981982.1 DUF488 family protein [Luteimonas sp. MC1572]QQO03281.1 DUF488 family protein [Luteimonas sp. MC1572]